MIKKVTKWWIDFEHPNGRFKYPTKDAFKLKELYRGYKLFASYPEAQIEATHQLLKYLFTIFPNIKKRFSNTFDYTPSLRNWNGVLMHVNLREDKTDLSPAWSLEKTNNFIAGLTADDLLPEPIEEIKIADWKKDNTDIVDDFDFTEKKPFFKKSKDK